MPYDWDERLSVGVEHIDVEHRQILRRVRHLAGAVMDGRPEEIRGSLKFLHGYLVEHFSHEEDWMAETGYPAAREHARHHAEMLDVVTSARLRAAEQPNALVRAAADLAAALDDHMQTEDLKLGRFVTARENLRALAEAGPGVGVALTPIPGSLAAVPRQEAKAAPAADAIDQGA
jgi:hemerythrin-like metal-binding protein